jgi:cell division protein FtsQ
MSTSRDLFYRRRLWARLLRYRVYVLGVIGAAAAAGLVWLVYFSTVLGVHRVEVAGTSLLTQAQVREAAGIPAGTALASVDIEKVAERVSQLPAVADVTVQRQWPRSMSIVVTERRAVAVVREGGRLSGMDAEGVRFRTFDQRPDRLPLVTARTPGAEDFDAALAEAATAVAALDTGVARRVDHVEVASRDAIVLVLADGTRVTWGSAEESDLKGEVLTVLLGQDASAYDVSVPARPTTAQ